MNKRMIYITDYDLKRLQNLLEAGTVRFPMDGPHLKRLKGELDRAIVVRREDIPDDVITMNSKVRLINLKTRENATFTLVFPSEANVGENKISVLAPIGTALLGYRVGDSIVWEVPGGVVRLRVLEVLYQPEAAGNFHE